MIIEKATVIEQNIMNENNISKKIDLGIIEELKNRRRAVDVRQRGEELEHIREMII